MQVRQHKRSIKTLQKIKADNLVSKILVPNKNNNPRHTSIADQWHKLLAIDRNKVIEFVFHHESNWMDREDSHDYISIPLCLLSFIEPSPHKMHKTLIIKNIHSFIHTPSGTQFKKRRIKLGLFEFTLHLYPNGLTQIHNGFIGYFVELTKIPSNVQYCVIYVHLWCVQTDTNHKTSCIIREKGDSEGWIWSLCSNDCQSHDTLQFEAELQILQIVYKPTTTNRHRKTEHYGHSMDSNPLKGSTHHYLWKWHQLEPILNKMNECTQSKQNLSFLSAHTPQDMFCFAIEYEHDTQHVSFRCKLLQLPPFVEHIRVLFEVSLGYPKYRNTFNLDYKQSECSLKLIEDDIEWLLDLNHEGLECVIRVEIIEETRVVVCEEKENEIEMKSSEKEKELFMKCWHDMNHCLVRYYEHNKKELKSKFCDFVESMQWNQCLVSQIASNGADTKQWKWDLLLQFEPNIDDFPIPQSIDFETVTQKQRFISYLFAYFYDYKKLPSANTMTRAANEITKDGGHVTEEFAMIVQKEYELKEESDALMVEEKTNRDEQNELNTAKNILEEELRVIQRKIDELEMEQNRMRSAHKDIVRQQELIAVQQTECTQDKERIVKQKQDNMNHRCDHIRTQHGRKVKLRDELRIYIQNRSKNQSMNEIEEIEQANEVNREDETHQYMSDLDPLEVSSDEIIELSSSRTHDDTLECEKENSIHNGHEDEGEDDIILNGFTPVVTPLNETTIETHIDIQIAHDSQNDHELLSKRFDLEYNNSNAMDVDTDVDIQMPQSIIDEILSQNDRQQQHSDITNTEEDVQTQETDLELPPLIPWPFEENWNYNNTNTLDGTCTQPVLDEPTVLETPNDAKDNYREPMDLKLRYSPHSKYIHSASPSSDRSVVDLVTKSHTCAQRMVNYITPSLPPLESVVTTHSHNDEDDDDEDPITWNHEANMLCGHASRQYTMQYSQNQYQMMIAGVKYNHQKCLDYLEKYKHKDLLTTAYTLIIITKMFNRHQTDFLELLDKYHQSNSLNVVFNHHNRYLIVGDIRYTILEFTRELINGSEQLKVDQLNKKLKLVHILRDVKKSPSHSKLLDTFMNEGHQYYSTHIDDCLKLLRECEKLECRENHDKRWFEILKSELQDPLIILKEKALNEQIESFNKLLHSHYKEIDNNQVQELLSAVMSGALDPDEMIIAQNAIFIGTEDGDGSKVKAFCEKYRPGKRYKKFKHKIDVQQFMFKVYLYPNGSRPGEKGFVQFGIALHQMPEDVASVVIYFKLFEAKTHTQFHCTKVFDRGVSDHRIVWHRHLLPLQKCSHSKLKSLEFGYYIQIVQIHKQIKKEKDGPSLGTSVMDHVKNEVLIRKGSDYLKSWHWELEKHVISDLFENIGRTLTLFYHPHPTRPAMCVSVGSLPKKKQLQIKFHVFKLPPRVEKVKLSFGLSTNSPNLHLSKDTMHTFSYQSTECTIELNKKQSEKFISQAKHYAGKLRLNFTFGVEKIYARGYLSRPYINKVVADTEQQSKTDVNNKNKSKVSSPNRTKKGIKNGKNMKRGNHKQRKRNNRKTKVKVKKKQNNSNSKKELKEDMNEEDAKKETERLLVLLRKEMSECD